MPGNSWRDKISRNKSTPDASAATNSDSSASISAAASAPAVHTTDASAIDLTSVSPELSALLQKRAALEQKMQKLVGGDRTYVDRFAVAPMHERKADYRRWESARDKTQSSEGGFNNLASGLSKGISTGLSTDKAPRTQTGLNDFSRPELSTMELPATNFGKRDAPLSKTLARDEFATDDFSRNDLTRDDFAKEAPAPLSMPSPARPKTKALANFRERPNATDNPRLRPQLKDPLTRSTSLTKKTSKPFESLSLPAFDKTKREQPLELSASKRFDERAKHLSGELEATTRYRDNAQRKLDINRGGSGDLTAQSDRLRQQALARRAQVREQAREQERRDQERRDQARRDRARARKQNFADA